MRRGFIAARNIAKAWLLLAGVCGVLALVGWGIGATLRLLALTVYALLVAPSLGLPRASALVSLAIFLFLSMLIEPPLLAYDR